MNPEVFPDNDRAEQASEKEKQHTSYVRRRIEKFSPHIRAGLGRRFIQAVGHICDIIDKQEARSNMTALCVEQKDIIVMQAKEYEAKRRQLEDWVQRANEYKDISIQQAGQLKAKDEFIRLLKEQLTQQSLRMVELEQALKGGE